MPGLFFDWFMLGAMGVLRRHGVLLVIVVLGAFARLYDLGATPPGFYRDEAYYALDAVGVLNGDWRMFFTANNGREPFFIYFMAPWIALFGQTVFSARLASAIVGILTIPALYLAGRSLYGQRAGVLAAAVIAGVFWHVALSRVAYRAISLPLFLCLAMAAYGFWRRSPENIARAVCAGLLVGACAYTYTSGQFVVAVFGLIGLVAVFRPAGRSGAAAFLAGIGFALVPLMLWFFANPEYVFGRAGQVSILNPAINQGDPIGTLVRGVGKAVGMWWTEGDRIWRHNLSLRPVFDAVTGTGFLLGLIAVGSRIVRRSTATGAIPGADSTVALCLVGLTLPTILAEDAPHFLRAIGALPVACLVAAIGLERGLAWLSRQGYLAQFSLLTRRRVSPPALLACILLGVSANITRIDYFGQYVNMPLTGYWLESQTPALAREILNSPRPAVEQQLLNNLPGLKYLAAGRFAQFEMDRISGPLPHGTYFFDPAMDFGPVRRNLSPNAIISCAEGVLAQADLDARPRTAYASVSTSAAQPASAVAAFATGTQLVGVAYEDATSPPRNIELRWFQSVPFTREHAIFVHWIRDGRLIAQHDGPGCDGLYGTRAWRAGDVVVDAHAGTNATDATEIRVGMYEREQGARSAVLSSTLETLDDSVIIWRR